ncbi:MAG TPA: hypothetical protein VJ807_04135 [Gaiellaceae bacterium]|nr:hypothetical protein [Gaiellaceae bacterium]
MTTTTLDLGRQAGVGARGWARFLPSLGGVGLVAGLIGLMLSPAADDTGNTATEVVAFAQSNDGWITAIALFGVASVALGGAFVAGLHARLQGIATATESTLVLIGGIAFTLCFALCWLVWMAPLVDLPGDEASALAQAEAYLAFDDVGWFALGAAGLGAALMAVPASRAAIRGGLPAWLGWLGVLAGLASVATIAFFGIFAWMAWIAAASVVLARDRSS